jgi:hypothetical protein
MTQTASLIEPPTPETPRRSGVGALARWWAMYANDVAYMVPLLVYTAMVIPGAYWCREQINPDAICYIRRATYLIHADFYNSVSGYWSPFLAWCLAPFLMADIDGLYAARIVLAGWGALFLIAFLVLMYQLGFGAWWRLAAGVVMATVAVRLAIFVVSPDLILGTFLLAWFAIAVDERFVHRRWWAFAGGALGGLAYLSKAYGLPFFFVHLPVTVLLWWLVGRASRLATGWREATRRFTTITTAPCVRALVFAVLGFVIVAGPWVGVLSWKYGKFTYSTVAGIAHAVVGPGGLEEELPIMILGQPPDPFLIWTEVTDTLPHAYWSPFSSRENFQHQLLVMRDNLLKMLEAIGEFDLLAPGLVRLVELRTGVVADPKAWGPWTKVSWISTSLVVGLLGFWAVGRLLRGSPVAFASVFLPLSAGAFGAGFLFVYFERRYVEPIVLPALFLSALWMVKQGGFNGAGLGVAWLWARRWRVGAVLVLLFGSFFLRNLYVAVGRMVTPPTSAYRTVAKAFENELRPGPVSSSDRVRGMYVAYLMGRKFVTFPRGGGGPEVWQDRLRQSNVQNIMRWADVSADDAVIENDSKRAFRMLKEFPWRRVKIVRLSRTRTVELWITPRMRPSTTQPTTMQVIDRAELRPGVSRVPAVWLDP